MDLTKQIIMMYDKNLIYTTTKKVTYINPIIELDKDREKGLLSGDGQYNPCEYKQVNSSTGLAVNYYLILEETGKIEDLEFEDKVEKPLKIKGGRKANIDVSYKREGKIVYVESKFLEPYYSSNETNREAYFDTKNYDVPDSDKNAWYDLLTDAQKYKFYNFSQLCRHLMAIWRKHKNDETPTPIVLQSVTWMMTDNFINAIDCTSDKENMIERRKLIKEEAIKCKERIDRFLIQIGWENMTFEVLNYNNMLDEIAFSKHLEEFKKRYFL